MVSGRTAYRKKISYKYKTILSVGEDYRIMCIYGEGRLITIRCINGYTYIYKF